MSLPGISKQVFECVPSLWLQNITNITDMSHPWAGEDLSLKIDEHDQTIWNCILES